MEKKRVSDRFTVGTAQPDREDLRQLVAEGYRTVINLRTKDEEDQTMTPEEEGEATRAHGLEYVHLPVSSDEMSHSLVDRFREEASRRPGPIFVHCASGKRSGAFTMLHLAAEQNIPGDEVVRQAEEMGFECDTPALEQFVQTYIDERLGQT